jgi:hypothetical protein
MTRLFNEQNEGWTELAQNYVKEIESALQPIILKAVKDNISLRDLHYVIEYTATDLILCEILDKR